MKYSIRVSRPLDSDVNEAMMLPSSVAPENVETQIEKLMPAIIETIMAGSRSIDELIIEIVGSDPTDSGAGFGARDLTWYELEWDVVIVATKKLLDLVGGGISVSMVAMEYLQSLEEEENDRIAD